MSDLRVTTAPHTAVKTDLVCPFQPPQHTSREVAGYAMQTTRYPMRNDFSFIKTAIQQQCSDAGPLELSTAQCYLGMLGAGEATLYIPELGKRQVKAGEWFMIAMDGLPLRMHLSSPVNFFAIACDITVFANLLADTQVHKKGRIKCLACPERKHPFFEQGPVTGKLARLQQAIEALDSNRLSQRLMLESNVLEWLSVLIEHPNLNQPLNCQKVCNSIDEDALIAAAHYLEKYLAEDHSIAKISRQVHLNEFKLKKGFRELFHTTVFGYLREKRMEHAGELLKYTSSSVIDVANAVGYSNPSHFARAFKQHHGMLPKHFQKTHT